MANGASIARQIERRSSAQPPAPEGIWHDAIEEANNPLTTSSWDEAADTSSKVITKEQP